MKWTVDRIENGFAVCETEDGTMIDIKLSALPKGIKECDVIHISVDKTETNQRKEKINELMNNLFKD